MNNTPRLLERHRLQQLARGLKVRLGQGSQKVADQLEALRAQLLGLQVAAEERSGAEHAKFQQQQTAAVNDWDQQRMAVWDDAERRAFKTVDSVSTQEHRLRVDARRQGDELTAEAKNRIADVDRRFMRSKDKTVAKLNKTKQQIEELAGALAVVQQEAMTLLAQRGMGLNVDTASRTFSDGAPTKAEEAIERCQSSIERARQLVHWLAHNRITRSIESVGFWLICIVCGAAITGLVGWFEILSWLMAIAAGFITTVVMGIVAIVAVHPWIRRLIRSELPKLEGTLAESHALQRAAMQLAMSENDAELRRLAAKRDTRMQEAVIWRDNSAKELNEKVKQEMMRLRTYAAAERVAVKEQLTQSLRSIDQAGAKRHQDNEAGYATARSQRAVQLDEQCAAIEEEIRRTELQGNARMRAATQKASGWLERSQLWCKEHFPEWNTLASNANWPEPLRSPVLTLGYANMASLLPEVGAIVAPVNFEPFRDHYLTVSTDAASPAASSFIQALVLRALTSLPPAKTQITVIDPQGLGRNYGWLMHLGDYDPELVTHRVWTQPNHIAKHLTNLALKAEDFIQQSLRNQYATIEEYNQDAGPLAEPYRIVVWNSFPLALDDTSWKPLLSLIDTGARCGIIPIFVLDSALPWEMPERRDLLMRRGLHIQLDPASNKISLNATQAELAELPIEPIAPPEPEAAQTLIHQVGRRAKQASRVEVPLSRIAPPHEQWWQADSSNSLEIPIGQSGVGRVQSLKLGVGTAQHAIVAGKTGSGKSTLLHAIITSAAVKYSPERLRLVLLDFKKGVEFQAYSQSELPHADIIGIESQREFGLSALEYVDHCMQNRGQMFRDAGVQDVQSWNLLYPQEQLPRMMIVIDEFQELFVEDDKLTSQVSLILDRIVRQGRSFGVHAILSSQTLAGAYSLPRTTMGQMGVRIALQCDASDAQMIFADDNPAASRLHHPGQAVYNDQGGRVEGNQAMQIGWLNKTEMLQWLGDMPARGYRNTDKSTNLLGRCVVFDGNRSSTWNRKAAARAVEASRATLNPDACWCVVGESVAISPAVTIPLTDQAGRNILLVGSEDEQTASVVMSIAGSFVAHHMRDRKPQISLIQAAKPTDAHCLSLSQRMHAHLPALVQVTDVRGADGLLGEIHATLKARMEAPDGYAEWTPILLNIVNIGRLRTFRPEDEYGMGSFGETKVTPDKQLEELLRDGPSHHIHVLIHAENANTVSRWLTRSAQRELEIRLLMQMSANDSTHLVDSVAASHLGAHVMLLRDDATSTEARFRPYSLETLTDLVPVLT